MNRILELASRELIFDFVRAAGPGGQNVNKVATAAQLRFDVEGSPLLSNDVKQRLKHLAGKSMTADGTLIIEARRYRTQNQNRADAFVRFEALLAKALQKPKRRQKTKPSAASREARLRAKKGRSEIKRTRQSREYE